MHTCRMAEKKGGAENDSARAAAPVLGSCGSAAAAAAAPSTPPAWNGCLQDNHRTARGKLDLLFKAETLGFMLSSFLNELAYLDMQRQSKHGTAHYTSTGDGTTISILVSDNQTHRNSMRGGGASASSCTALGFRAVSRPMCSRSSAAHAQCNTGWACPASAVTCSTCLRVQKAHLYIFIP